MSLAHPDDNNNEIERHGEDPWAGMRDDFDDGSELFKKHFGLSLPRLRSDFGRNGKGWVDDLTGEVFGELELVLLAMPPSRQFWIKSIDEGAAGPPDCRSFDLERPDPASPAVQNDLCGTCPHSKWATGEDGKRIRPRCGESVNVIAYNVTEDVFTWLRFGGTAIKPFKTYVSALAARRLPHFALQTKITLEAHKQPGMEWLVPVFGIGESLTPELVAPMREVARRAMETFGQVYEEMTAAEKAAGPFDEDASPSADREPFEGDDEITDAEIVDDNPGRPFTAEEAQQALGADEVEDF